MPPRCPNGTRRNKKTGNCESTKAKSPSAKPVTVAKTSRCPKGSRRDKKTGNCVSTKAKSPSAKPISPSSRTVAVGNLVIGTKYNFYLHPDDELRENKITGTVAHISDDSEKIAHLTDVAIKHTYTNNKVHIEKLPRVPVNLSDDNVQRITVA